MSVYTQKHLYELVKHFGTALVITYGTSGKIHARPMAVAQLEPGLDAYFATSLTSPKVAEIESDPRIAIAFQSKSEDAVIYGKATIVRDRDLIHKLWSEPWRLWFPKGKDDPNICLVKIEPEDNEYWDRSGAEGIKFLFEGAKAYLQGRTPDGDDDPNQHARVKLT